MCDSVSDNLKQGPEVYYRANSGQNLMSRWLPVSQPVRLGLNGIVVREFGPLSVTNRDCLLVVNTAV